MKHMTEDAFHFGMDEAADLEAMLGCLDKVTELMAKHDDIDGLDDAISEAMAMIRARLDIVVTANLEYEEWKHYG